jgi:hypothetical protein
MIFVLVNLYRSPEKPGYTTELEYTMSDHAMTFVYLDVAGPDTMSHFIPLHDLSGTTTMGSRVTWTWPALTAAPIRRERHIFSTNRTIQSSTTKLTRRTMPLNPIRGQTTATTPAPALAMDSTAATSAAATLTAVTAR